jgi:uncharacterized protein YndB with AHSA1/START domain
MTKTIRRELKFAQSPEAVWRSLTDSATLAEWMHPRRAKTASPEPARASRSIREVEEREGFARKFEGGR